RHVRHRAEPATVLRDHVFPRPLRKLHAAHRPSMAPHAYRRSLPRGTPSVHDGIRFASPPGGPPERSHGAPPLVGGSALRLPPGRERAVEVLTSDHLVHVEPVVVVHAE